MTWGPVVIDPEGQNYETYERRRSEILDHRPTALHGKPGNFVRHREFCGRSVLEGQILQK